MRMLLVLFFLLGGLVLAQEHQSSMFESKVSVLIMFKDAHTQRVLADVILKKKYAYATELPEPAQILNEAVREVGAKVFDWRGEKFRKTVVQVLNHKLGYYGWDGDGLTLQEVK